MEFKALFLADQAVTFEFGSVISPKINQMVLSLHHVLKEAIFHDHLEGIYETVPSFRSLTVHYDSRQHYPEGIVEIIQPFIDALDVTETKGVTWEIPCCYGAEYAPDLVECGERTGLAVDQIIEIHSAQTFDVFMLGFLPGFGFLGTLDERLKLPRRSEPRTAVPKGSVAIADQMSAVYPSQSPGGWHLIGRTPIEMFNLQNEKPPLLNAGDQVIFKPISIAEYIEIRDAITAGTCDPQVHCLQEQGA